MKNYTSLFAQILNYVPREIVKFTVLKGLILEKAILPGKNPCFRVL